MEERIDITESVRAAIARHDMLPSGAFAVVLVSGGGDSVALLHLLINEGLVDPERLQVLHVDHQLRGAESDADRDFVADLARRLDVAIAIQRVDVAAIARETGRNVEEVGRSERYGRAEDLLGSMAERLDAPVSAGRILVAHTRDDSVETLLMRLAQGAGSGGLVSLRAVRGSIVRPMIDVSRDEARAYLRSLGESWREDATNLDTDRLRARIRHELVPVFRDINPRFDEAVARTMRVMAAEDDLLDEMAEAFARDFTERVDGEVAFVREMMATLSRPMLRRTVRAALLDAFPQASRIEFDHVEKLVDGMQVDGFSHDLGYGLRAHDEYGRMVVSRTGEGPAPLAPCLLPVPGTCDLGSHGRLIAEETTVDDTSGSDRSVTVELSPDVGTLDVGPVREGERMEPLGMNGSAKKLSDMLVDEKVPRRHRQAMPVVRDGGTVVWIAGLRMSERYKVTGDTVRAVRLTWVPNEDEDA